MRREGSILVHDDPRNFSATMIGTLDNSEKAFERFLELSNILEGLWLSNSLSSKFIGWKYAYDINTRSIRIYPKIDFVTVFGKSVSWAMVSFFSNESNLKKYSSRPLCLKPSIDMAGNGLHTSCCQASAKLSLHEKPYFFLNCIDIMLESLVQEIRRFLIHARVPASELVILSRSQGFRERDLALIEIKTGDVSFANCKQFPDFNKLKMIRSFDLFELSILWLPRKNYKTGIK